MTVSTPSDRRASALAVLMPGFVGTDLPGWVDALLREGLGGVCLFAGTAVVEFVRTLKAG